MLNDLSPKSLCGISSQEFIHFTSIFKATGQGTNVNNSETFPGFSDFAF